MFLIGNIDILNWKYNFPIKLIGQTYIIRYKVWIRLVKMINGLDSTS
jgi:hypothetical protein